MKSPCHMLICKLQNHRVRNPARRERAEVWFTTPQRARAAVNTRELQPLQVCQHILDTRQRLHSSMLDVDPALDAADVQELLCSPSSQTGLCSQASLRVPLVLASCQRSCSICHRVCYFSLNSFSVSSKLGGHIRLISECYC